MLFLKSIKIRVLGDRGVGVIVRVFEAFSGVGAQRMALRNLGIEHEVVGVSEIDIPAINSYAAIHEDLLGNDDFNYPSKEEMIEYLASKNIGLDVKTGKIKLPKQLDKLKLIYKASVLSKCVGDISIIDPHDLPDMDLFTYSFPCQDLSVAGQRAGMIKGQTRSGLLYECEKIIEAKRPKYLLLENVKNLVGKKFKPKFEEWLAYLETLGYTNYWQVLNAKDYGVPQNRERVFVVSILGDHSTYVFPTPIPLTRVVKDILEDEVEERFYINKPIKLVNHHQDMTRTDVFLSQIDRLLQKMDEIPSVICVDKSINNPQLNNIVNCITAREDRGISNHRQEGTAIVSNEPKVLIEPTINYKGKKVKLPCICASRGRNPKNTSDRTIGAPTEQMLEINTHGTSNTITTVQKDNYAIENNYRVRKLTPLECWRLMGFSDGDYFKAKKSGVSNTQLYKQAGNSIVVPVLEGIFSELFK